MKNNIVIACLALTLCSASAGIASAAPYPTIAQDVGVCDPNAPTHCAAPTSGGAIPIVPTPSDLTTTQVGGAITTHGTFQSALAASTTRKGCLYTNTSLDTEYVFFGLTASATTSNAHQVAPGAGMSCATQAGGVVDDNIAVTSKVTDGATFVVSSQ